jgi:hypothetical protein
MDNKRLLVTIVIGVILVGGLAFLLWPRQANPVTVTENQNGLATSIPTETSVVISPENTPTEGSGDSATPTTEATVEEPSLPPTPRQELESTNPDTVSLASGGLQLVEVFAFW